VSGVKKTFLDAVAACGAETAAPAKLFEPTSEAQNEAIFNIMKGIFGDETEYFVGIKLDPNDPDGGTFKYVSDESAVQMTIWGSDAATNRNTVNHCVAIDSQSFGLMWTDRYCSDKYTFVCQTKSVAELAGGSNSD